MALIDWLILLFYFMLSAGIGLYYASRASRNTSEFFLSGRNLPWWLAGTSMVATTFAADTPLAVTELVAKNGIAGNWLWWNFVFGNMLTVFFFSRLWRRSGILTDVEFLELRYSGRSAAFLRAFRSVYLGLFINCVIIGWVNLAMASILEVLFHIPHQEVQLFLAITMSLTALYSALSGLWGVAVTDAFQFFIAIGGCVVLAILVLRSPAIGGLSGLVAKVPAWALHFTPEVRQHADHGASEALSMSFTSFFAFIGIQWWACWYPGSEPGGGGYVAQRMMSAKDEKHSLFATLWFTIAHYCIRPWPWIIVALASLILYPNLPPDQKRMAYVYAMRDFLPAGLKGLLVAAFFAAYMSTVSTQLNWGTSYLINDFYRRFFVRNQTERHYVRTARIVTVLLMILSLLVTLILSTISSAWSFVIEAGAGLGLVLILRWYWWRINAWSEIAAMIAPAVSYIAIRALTKIEFPNTLFLSVSFTTIVWLLITFITKPEREETLSNFFRRAHPGGWWAPVARQVPEAVQDKGYRALFVDWIAGVILIYSVLFGVGKWLLGNLLAAAVFFAIAFMAGLILYYHLSSKGWFYETKS